MLDAHTSCLKSKCSQGPETSEKVLWIREILICSSHQYFAKLWTGCSIWWSVLYLQFPGTDFRWDLGAAAARRCRTRCVAFSEAVGPGTPLCKNSD